jgi:phosphatidate cytidylyltransferase
VTPPQLKKSDLGVRTASAVVMLVVAGSALLLGGYFWMAFVALVAIGVLWEWVGLVHGITPHPVARGLWNAGGIVYVGIGAVVLAYTRVDGSEEGGLIRIFMILGAVIATDVGAYFAGRTFGGPKIAPKISPSKTWSGLIGGMIGAVLVLMAVIYSIGDGSVAPAYVLTYCAIGALAAIVAQTGDFFESWMKRRAGVKDSSHLIPGHGGLFDRVDGLLSVCFVTGIVYLVLGASGFA